VTTNDTQRLVRETVPAAIRQLRAIAATLAADAEPVTATPAPEPYIFVEMRKAVEAARPMHLTAGEVRMVMHHYDAARRTAAGAS
jgi:hypothetical protein